MIVFSDLDGTLIDHQSYDFAAAKPALERLAALNVPVILATSKTAAEVVGIREAMGLADYPAIVENGAGVLEPGETQTTPEDGDPIHSIRKALAAIAPALRQRFSGFGDVDAETVSTWTGLSTEAATLAKMRRYSEPGQFDGTADDEAALIAALGEHGVHARRGGRFLTLSLGATKADRIETIASRLDTTPPRLTVALGDAPNDIDMLERADIGFIVNNPGGTPIPTLEDEATGRIMRTMAVGPHGFAEAIDLALTRHGL